MHINSAIVVMEMKLNGNTYASLTSQAWKPPSCHPPSLPGYEWDALNPSPDFFMLGFLLVGNQRARIGVEAF
jgi:hypothetical protein